VKKLLWILVLVLLWCNVGFAEIIFKNCNLSPNLGMTDFYVYLEKGEIEIRDESGGITIFAIDDNQSSEITASRLIAIPSDNDISNWPKKNQTKFFNYLNNQIDERYLLNYSTGFVRQILKAHVGADQEMIENLNEAKPLVETNCRVVNLYQKQEVVEKVSTQKSNLISTTHFTKKQKKKYDKYMSKNEIKLCISFINNYGWFDDQTVRYTAIYNRGINCDKYQRLARDEENRRNKIADSGKKLLDATVDSVYGTGENSSSNNKTHCRVTDIGGRLQVFCN